MSDLFHVKCLSCLWVHFLSVLIVQRKKGKYVYYSLCPPEDIDIDILGNVASLFDVLTPKLECNQAAYYKMTSFNEVVVSNKA